MKKHTVYLINGFGGPNWCFYSAAETYKKAGYNVHILKTVKFNTSKPHVVCDSVYEEMKNHGMENYSIVGYSYGGIIGVMILQKIIKAGYELPANVVTTPAEDIFRIRLLFLSATYTFPLLSAATPIG